MASVIYFLVRTVYINGIAVEFFNFLMVIFALLFWIYLTIMIPLYIQTEDKALVIHRIVTSVEIPYESMTEVRCIDSKEMGSVSRRLGSGGYGGNYGTFYSKPLGEFTMFATELNKYVLIKTVDHTYVISCSRAPELVASLNSAIGHK